MAGFNDVPFLYNFAIPAVCLLIVFLGYLPQCIFHCSTLDPGPPSPKETALFNALLLCVWYTYLKAATVDPGRYVFSRQVVELDGSWCKKCANPKPPRAHHCRLCGRCIPKMDHHCPWTRNCVSMTTFPHFLRFIVYANLSLWTLARLLWLRLYSLWQVRNLPAHLGPSLRALVALAFSSLVCFCTGFVLGIMLINTVRTWLFNCTMIESWELDRHEAFVERGGRDAWDIAPPGEEKSRFERIEFPYDVGFFSNMAQAMGTPNVLLWFCPFASNPLVGNGGQGTGWTWEENGFNSREGMWPPPDPERIRWHTSRIKPEAQLQDTNLGPDKRKWAFRDCQKQDAMAKKSLIFELEEVDDHVINKFDDLDAYGRILREPLKWSNSDDERLQDHGVDDEATNEAPFHSDDDVVPLGELLRRRKAPRAG